MTKIKFEERNRLKSEFCLGDDLDNTIKFVMQSKLNAFIFLGHHLQEKLACVLFVFTVRVDICHLSFGLDMRLTSFREEQQQEVLKLA